MSFMRCHSTFTNKDANSQEPSKLTLSFEIQAQNYDPIDQIPFQNAAHAVAQDRKNGQPKLHNQPNEA